MRELELNKSSFSWDIATGFLWSRTILLVIWTSENKNITVINIVDSLSTLYDKNNFFQNILLLKSIAIGKKEGNFSLQYELSYFLDDATDKSAVEYANNLLKSAERVHREFIYSGLPKFNENIGSRYFFGLVKNDTESPDYYENLGKLAKEIEPKNIIFKSLSIKKFGVMSKLLITKIKKNKFTNESVMLLKAFLLVSPLLFFIIITYIFPIGEMFTRSIDDRMITNMLPKTFKSMENWDGKELPPEEVFASFLSDFKVLAEKKEHGKLGQRLNKEKNGFNTISVSYTHLTLPTKRIV